MKITSQPLTRFLLLAFLILVACTVVLDKPVLGATIDIVKVTVNGIDHESSEIDCQEAVLEVVWGTDNTTTRIYSRDAAYFDGVPRWLQGPNECDTLFEDVEFPRGYANRLTVTITARTTGGQLVQGSSTATVPGSWVYNQYEFGDLELAPIPPPAPPDKPTLINPPNGATISAETPVELQWSTAARATQYFAELFTPSGTSKPASKLSSTAWYVGTLAPGYYEWHAEAYDSAGNYSGWSSTYHFTVVASQPPDKPTLVNPPDGAIISDETPIELQWTSANRATQYFVELFTSTGTNKPASKLSSTAWYLGTLPAGQYNWHVEAYDSNGVYSGWTSTFGFTVISPSAGECPGQYRAEYFDNQTLSGDPVFVQCEDWPIDHDWGYDGPGHGISGDSFSVRWTGRAFFESTVHEVYYQSDDGMRWWIESPGQMDESPDKDNWTNPALEEQHYAFHQRIAGDQDIKVEYYNGGGYARAKFRWESLPSTGPIAGRVVDAGGNGIEGVSVRALAGSGGPERITGADGTFRFESLATHEYTVVPSKEGYTFEPSSEWVAVYSDKAESIEFVGTPTNDQQWAILYYFAGDNDLSPAFAEATHYVATHTENPNYAIAALYDGAKEGDGRYWLIDDNASFVEKGEFNTGDPQTLVDFVDWALGQIDAEHVALVIVGHGNVSGTAVDDFSRVLGLVPDALHMRDLRNAFQDIHARHGKLDVVLMESCLMGTIEVAYQLRDYVDYFVASQSLLHVNTGFGPRMSYLDNVFSDTDPHFMAITMATAYGENADKENLQVTMSVAQLSALQQVVTPLNTLSDLLRQSMNLYGDNLKNSVVSQVQRFDNASPEGPATVDDELVDLRHFVMLVMEAIPESAVQTAAQQVLDALDNYVVYELHRSGRVVGINGTYTVDNSHGVSISFFSRPRSFFSGTNFNFAEGTSWEQLAIEDTGALSEGSTWGQMLVAYVHETNPNAEDDPSLPPLIAPSRLNIDGEKTSYLPALIR